MSLASFEERVKKGEYASAPLATDRAIDLNKELVRNGEGKPKALLANAITLLRYSPTWMGVLAYDEFRLRVVIKNSPIWEKKSGSDWTDHDDSLTAEWLQHQGVLVSSKTAAEAVQVVAHDNSFHPVREYLETLKHDSKPRIDNWLPRYLGTESTVWTRTVGPRWLISAVARAMSPGCQVDHTLLIEGPQGIQKSKSLRTLAGDEWFADHISDFGTKDSRIELAGKWIFEFSELRVRRGEIERVKAFLTARTDHFRLPYSRRAEDVPRSCVFAASVNDETSLTDETGNRRFWPVKCGVIDVDGIGKDRDQLWAEAYQRFLAGCPWWLDSDELNKLARKEQEERYEGGVWDDRILAWCEAPTPGRKASRSTNLASTAHCVTVTEILVHGIEKDLERCTQQDRNQVARCLIHAGWKRVRSWSGPSRGQWFYTKGE
jgi:predicted P-loop ATPase